MAPKAKGGKKRKEPSSDEEEDEQAISDFEETSKPISKKAKRGKQPAPPPASAPSISTSSSSSKSYWLMKAEAESRMHNGKDVRFSIDDLQSINTSAWDGVRNHQAKNFMKNQMKLNDMILFYNSNCKVPGVAGLARVSKEAFPDPSAFDKTHAYYDPKSDQTKPTWYCVEVTFVKKFNDLVTLKEMKELHSKPGNPLAEMTLFKPGRLSVQPVKEEEYNYIVALGEAKQKPDV